MCYITVVRSPMWTVVGFFKNGRNVAPSQLRDDVEGITFELEPTNAFDPNAVKVLMQGSHVAYVSRVDAPKAKAFLALNKPYDVVVTQTFDASATLSVVRKSLVFTKTQPADLSKLKI